jgi:hypothetical protein
MGGLTYGAIEAGAAGFTRTPVVIAFLVAAVALAATAGRPHPHRRCRTRRYLRTPRRRVTHRQIRPIQHAERSDLRSTR